MLKGQRSGCGTGRGAGSGTLRRNGSRNGEGSKSSEEAHFEIDVNSVGRRKQDLDL